MKTWAGDGTSCRGDSYCDDATHLCKLLKRQGEACARNGECFYTLACQAGKCQPITDGLCK